jgi:glutathione-regulated potassium-efflux system ancillary protein KefC
MEDYFEIISLVAVCSALLAWLACRGKQPIILGYFLCGVIVGPWLTQHVALLENTSKIGITLLLFLAGLVLHPRRLAKHLKMALVVTVGGCAATAIIVFAFLFGWGGFDPAECVIAALALMFSSTILAVKLLPTTTLHQKRMGSICIAVLIAEDIIAVIVIMLVGLKYGSTTPATGGSDWLWNFMLEYVGGTIGAGGIWLFILLLFIKAIVLIAVAVFFEQFILRVMMRTSERFNEMLIMLCLAWCLGIAVFAEHLGLSYEIGAFVAGVAMARSKISLVLSEQLKPLRDFFLMFFFVVLGAQFDLLLMREIWLPALLLGGVIVALRPFYMRGLFRLFGEEKKFSSEVGFRLGQASEFALIVAVAATHSNNIGDKMSHLVQLAAVFTMIVSSYIVVFRYPTPLGAKTALKKD